MVQSLHLLLGLGIILAVFAANFLFGRIRSDKDPVAEAENGLERGGMGTSQIEEPNLKD